MASVLLEIRDEHLHLPDLPTLRGNDFIGEFTHSGVGNVGPSLVMMAIEWCGIIARMYDTSSTVAWLRSSHNAAAKTNTLAVSIPASIGGGVGVQQLAS